MALVMVLPANMAWGAPGVASARSPGNQRGEADDGADRQGRDERLGWHAVSPGCGMKSQSD